MRLAWIAVPVIGVTLGMGALAWSDQSGGSTARVDTYQQLELFAEVLARVQSDYVTPVDNPKAIEAAIDGMLTSLDPHSGYMSPEEYRDSQVAMRGEYGGLGIEVTSEDRLIKVVSPMDDTPASRAGIEGGDYITHIDGQPILGLSLNEAVDRMRGAVGTTIEIRIAREDAEPRDITLVREKITVKPVTARLEGDVGVVRIATFNNERTGAELEDALRDLRQQTNGNLQGIVLDLRNNPGGLLVQAYRVADAFLDGGEITYTKGRRDDDIERYNAHGGDLVAGVPIVVLINGASASASEIVAGALQDRGRAVVVGTTSFGKGSVQTVIPLKGGRDGALRLTTARYFTPSNRSIQGAGIDPDFEVSQVREDPEKLSRLGLSEADLPNALANQDGLTRRGPHLIEDQPPEDWDKAEDYQLRRAFDLLREGAVAERLRERNRG
jgi:carboxyl-terminal processing protease